MPAEVVTKRTIEKRRRGIFGWMFLLLFWAFNVLMLYGLFSGVGESTKRAATLTDPGSRLAHDAGTGLGVMLVLFIWAAGAVILGLMAYFTRGRREWIELEVKGSGK